ncbi:efflux RND transporter periplasmic adaptor subunit [Aestuariivirga sp.]|uniref:efflux RND transporter periplasmic adaptor subunit n=1 Tax=Aestuariivirga sp. TaxID=2650926 RepID=UPI003918F5FE
MLRRLIWAIILLAVLAALAWAFWPRPIPVETAEAARRDIAITVEEEGKSRIREVFTVSAPISGQVQRSALHAGDEVLKDETVVAALRPAAPGLLDARLKRVAEAAAASARASVDLAAAEVRQAEAQLTFLNSELSRAERLSRQGTISERALDKAKLDVETAAAALESARASLTVRQRELERAEAALIETGTSEGPCCTEIKAPVTGRILRVLTESEQVVQAGTPLVEIGDPADIEIVADVLSRDAVEIRPGARAVIDNWGGPPLEARVRRVEPSAVTKISALGIEEQRVSVVLDLAGGAPEAAALGDGFRVVTRITVWEGRGLLAVPVASLFRQGGNWAAYAVVNGRAELRRLEIGPRNGAFASIEAGLSEGETVILHPSDQLTDGAAVTPTAAE